MKINKDTARDIIEHHFGKAPKDLEEMEGGFANFVYMAKVDAKKYIVRISDEPNKLQSFMKEQWAVEKVKEKKIIGPNILEVANQASKFPYMIVEFMQGIPALNLPSNDRYGLIRQMGKMAAVINSISTNGYGNVFDWSSNRLSYNETWADYLKKELEVPQRIALLEKHKILENGALTDLKNAYKEVEGWNYKPSLNHGDLRLKNILVDEKGKISCVLDWEMCISNVAPQWELSISLHDLTIDERQAFLEGYGLSGTEYRNRALGVKFFNIINYAPFLESAYEDKNDKSKEYIDVVKTRLRGSLDMYSF